MDNHVLLHLATEADLNAAAAAGRYRPASLETEGFIHCCYPHQLHGVLERWFKGNDALVLLTLDPTRLNAPLVCENLTGGEELFPHLYGAVPLEAIARQQPFGRDSEARRKLHAGPDAL